MQNQTISTVANTAPDTSMSYSTIILDGGMGRELERRGAPFRQPEWSALALSLAPDIVRETHLDYIQAGADVITVNSYAVTPYHLGDRFFDEAELLIETAAKLAFEAVQDSKKLDHKNNNNASATQIAGCLPPLFGSYRPELFDSERAHQIARPFLQAQAPYADIWLVETQSCIVEATTWQRLITEFTAQNGISSKPIWIAFTLEDSALDLSEDSAAKSSTLKEPTLRSGEYVATAVQAMIALKVDAILFNCSQPEVMSSALKVAKATIEKAAIKQDNNEKSERSSTIQKPKLGVYANAFASKQVHKQANSQLRSMREDTTPEHYLTWARLWQESGADIIGGCCGIGVEHIALLANHIKDITYPE